MNVIIFGAGASYGSDPNNNTPPLGKNLFDALEIFDPITWGSLNSTWKEKFREDFEPAMKELIDLGLFAAPFQWAMAEYFFTQFKAYESNYCINILKAIDPKLKECTLASLNYDLLIQQSVPIKTISILHSHIEIKLDNLLIIYIMIYTLQDTVKLCERRGG